MRKYTKTTIQSYDDTVRKYEALTGRLHPENEAKFFLSLIKRKSRILDLGCGTGRDSRIFAEQGFAVTGIDLSEKMLNYARKRCAKAVFKKMDIKNLKLKNNSFDAIWANASLLHLKKEDLPKSVRNIAKVLKPGGIFYVSVKKGKGEGETSDKRYGGVVKYWSYFAKKELENIIKNSGFNIIKIYLTKYNDKYMTRPWLIIFARKSI